MRLIHPPLQGRGSLNAVVVFVFLDFSICFFLCSCNLVFLCSCTHSFTPFFLPFILLYFFSFFPFSLSVRVVVLDASNVEYTTEGQDKDNAFIEEFRINIIDQNDVRPFGK